jgi:hypothetical protein
MTDFWIQESTFLSSFCSQPRTLTTTHTPTTHPPCTQSWPFCTCRMVREDGGFIPLPLCQTDCFLSPALSICVPERLSRSSLLTTSALVSASLLPSCRPSRHSLALPPFQRRLACPPLPIFAFCAVCTCVRARASLFRPF